MATTQQQPEVGAGAAAGTAAAGVGAGAATGVVGAKQAADIALATVGGAAKALAGIVSALVSFLARKRALDEAYLRAQLAARAKRPGVPTIAPNVIDELIAEEQRRDEVFALKQSERVMTESNRILRISDPEERKAEMQKLADREQRYTQQRAEAMAARAIAALDRVGIRMESPQGAFWKLDPTVKEHTKGCLVMGGRFWPWEVLDRVHPPRHPGCPCRLVGYGQAVRDGDMASSAVQDVGTAIRSAAHVLMEAEPEAPELGALQELVEAPEPRPDLRSALIAVGLTTAERFDAVSEAFNAGEARDFRGRWVRKLGDVADEMATRSVAWAHHHRGMDPAQAPPHEEVVKNWTKHLRGRLSKDQEAHRALDAAMKANEANPLWRSIVAKYEPDHVVVVTPPEQGKMRALIDSTSAMHRMAGTSIVTDDGVKELAAVKPPADMKHRPAASSGYGLGAVLRHEYGHSIDDSLPADVRKKVIAAIPDPGEDLSYYAGYHAAKGNEREVIPELLAIITQPGFDAKAWPDTVQTARKLLLDAIGVPSGRA